MIPTHSLPPPQRTAASAKEVDWPLVLQTAGGPPPGAAFDLDWLLAPMAPARWIADYHERQPLVIARHDPEYYGSFFTAEEFDQLLACGEWRWPAVRLLKAGRDIPTESYTHDGANSRIDLAAVLAAFQQGTTIVLETCLACPPVAALVHNVRSHLSYLGGASIWLTPQGAASPKGFHYDDQNVLVLQISGSKHWRIYEAPVSFPIESMPTPENLSPGKLLYEVTLRTGDLLYLPRGFGHEVTPMPDEPSLHIGVAWVTPTVYDVLRDALHALAERDERLRQALPAGFAQAGGAQALDLVRTIAGAMREDLDLETAVSERSRAFLRNAPPPFRGAFAQACRRPPVTLVSDRFEHPALREDQR